jgi:hypothetical protein
VGGDDRVDEGRPASAERVHVNEDDVGDGALDPVVLGALYGRIATLAVRSGADALAVSQYLVNALDPRLSASERGVIVSSIARAIVSAEPDDGPAADGADDDARMASVAAQIRAAARQPGSG